MNFNRAVIVGRLTRDPEIRALPSGQSLASFGMATNRVWVNQNGEKQEATEYHNVVAFGKLADICSRYLNKGRLALIEGRLQTRSWQDQDGNKRYRTEIIADNMQMGPRSEASVRQDQESFEQSDAKQTPPSQEEIPVIEADEPTEEQEKQEENTENKKPSASTAAASQKKQGVDVKNIPF
jgi:single-strand DNA-binding protein